MTTTLISPSTRAALAAIAVLLLGIGSPFSLHAQGTTGAHSGRILNEGTGEYLRKASVSVVGMQLEYYTRMRYDSYENYFRPTNVANLSWYAPYRACRLQWNTNWRHGYRTEAETASNGWPNFVRESLTHTFDFTWSFRHNMDVFLNARNGLNQDGGTCRLRSDVRTRWVETGAIWSTGVRATF